MITGAAAGIGAACSSRLATLGFQVFAGVRRQESLLTLRERGAERVTPVLLDTTKKETIAAAREQIAATVGDAGLAGLINNAGIAVSGPIEFVPIDDLRRQFETNVYGVVAVTQAFLPLLRQGRGRIINVGSASGRLAAPFAGPYAASKFALRAITDALRLELRTWDLPVCAIEVGPVATGIWDKSRVDLDDRWESMTPTARELYDPLFRAIRRGAEDRAKSGIDVDDVVAAVVRAMTSLKPRTRYLVGMVARQTSIVSLLPDPLRDWVVLRHLGL